MIRLKRVKSKKGCKGCVGFYDCLETSEQANKQKIEPCVGENIYKKDRFYYVKDFLCWFLKARW